MMRGERPVFMGGGGKIMFSIVYISLEDVPASFKKCSFDENDKNEKSFMHSAIAILSATYSAQTMDLFFSFRLPI